MERRARFEVPRHSFASDVDGDLHVVIIDRDVDCSGWRLRCAADGREFVEDFYQRVVWGDCGFSGLGEPRTAWVALAQRTPDRAIVFPDGSTLPL